jgi:N utilization substance protein B
MGARRTGRERALQALYQLEMSLATVAEALESAWAAAEEPKRDPDAVKFARELVEGVQAHRDEIDELIERHSHNWRLDRMSRIDRNVLRLGIFELKYRPDIQELRHRGVQRLRQRPAGPRGRGAQQGVSVQGLEPLPRVRDVP